MQIERSDEQRANADPLRTETLQSIANLTIERFAQSEKQPSKITSIDEGMQIERSDEQAEKAHTPRT
jgi:ABC-type proline/glycine betaine transport system substrate-binding protein